jgi:Fe/S biogenesis protein NfuA
MASSDVLTDSVATDAPSLVTLSDEAHAVVLRAISQEDDAERLALWLEVRGVQEGSFAYDLYFQALADAGTDDAVGRSGNLQVVVPASSIERLRGARLEWSEEGAGGLMLVNPNAPEPEEAGAGVPPEVLAAGLDNDFARRVHGVLEEMVNPSIASHGGRADLVALDTEGGVVYLRLSGGCQGCAMSRMTLTQGIETALRDEVPEIRSVVDVTDHQGGENPYY